MINVLFIIPISHFVGFCGGKNPDQHKFLTQLIVVSRSMHLSRATCNIYIIGYVFTNHFQEHSLSFF